MSYVISQYISDDYEDVWTLHKRTVAENDGFVKNLSFHTDFQDIAGVYKAFFVLKDGAKVIGMIGLKHIDPETFEVKRLQVAASYQGQGQGRQLVQHAMNSNVTLKAKKITQKILNSQALQSL